MESTTGTARGTVAGQSGKWTFQLPHWFSPQPVVLATENDARTTDIVVIVRGASGLGIQLNAFSPDAGDNYKPAGQVSFLHEQVGGVWIAGDTVVA